MGDRVRQGHPIEVPAPPECPAKHCWVTIPCDGGPTRPGLLLEWAMTSDRIWMGRVIYPAQVRPGTWATVEEWLPATHLAP